MKTSDIIGVYGALVATILTVIKIREHFVRKPVLIFKLIGDCDLPSRHIEITITNLANHQIKFDFLGLGYAWRPWLTPWKRVSGEAIGMNMSRIVNMEESIIYDEIEAGEVLYASISNQEDWKRRIKWFGKEGFDHGLSLYVEHSQHSIPYTVTLG